VPHVHVLDEAEDVAALPEEPRHREDALLVHPALDDHVHLHGQSRLGGRLDSVEYPLHRKIHVVHRREHGVVERVEADRDALQARVPQGERLLREQRAVGRQRQVETVDRGELLDEALEFTPNERLATGDSDLLDAVRHEYAGQPLDLLEGEQLPAFEEPVVAPEDLLRHAVDAAKVAPVGDRDAEVSQRAPERVPHRHTFTVTGTAEAAEGSIRGGARSLLRTVLRRRRRT
jgi:hypothetical protein